MKSSKLAVKTQCAIFSLFSGKITIFCSRSSDWRYFYTSFSIIFLSLALCTFSDNDVSLFPRCLAFQFLLLMVLRRGHEPKSGNRLGQQFRDYGDVVATGAGTPRRLADSSAIVILKFAFRNDG